MEIDLTRRAVSLTEHRLSQFGLKSNLKVGDAESLTYPSDHFDVVYSWGVLHHSPDTPRAISEVCRVLKPGGAARIMMYHKHSIVGYMLWVRYALLKFHPTMTLADIYAKYLESPGTKAYSVEEARHLFRSFTCVEIATQLTHGDLLTSSAGQRHRGFALSAARVIWPRALIKRFFPSYGLFMLITATK
jgi:ubiquinone/menaquinone biosynthesis C-methylase UbiE